jgi:hypothetical protein
MAQLKELPRRHEDAEEQAGVGSAPDEPIKTAEPVVNVAKEIPKFESLLE